MIRPESFSTHTLIRHPLGGAVARILCAAMQAVEPGTAVRRFVHRERDSIFIDGRKYLLDDIGQIRVLGLGKASAAMTLSLADLLSDHATRGLLIPKQTPAHIPAGFEVIPGGHPIPDENSLKAGTKDQLTKLVVTAKPTGRQKDLLDRLGYNNWRKLSSGH